MNVTCNHCKTKLNIPDHKIPSDRESILKCPKCSEKIQIPVVKQQAVSLEKKGQVSHHFVEEQLNALICIDGDDLRKKVYSDLRQMDFNTEAVIDTKAALNKLEYNIYHLVVIDDAFDRNKGLSGVIARMNAIDMSLRRRICLVWLSNSFKTGDDMMALHSSVNYIIHIDDIRHMEVLLSRALTEHKNLYTVYNGSLKVTGKA